MFDRLAMFKPGEAAEITGLSTVLLGDWRRRGFMPYATGHSRFDLFDLSVMAFLRQMSELGIGPQRASPMADRAALSIAYGALRCPAAWDDGEEHREHTDGRAVQFLLRARMMQHVLKRGQQPMRYLVLTAEGDSWHEEPAALPAALEKAASPAVVVDLVAMGGALQQRVGRPLVLRIEDAGR